MKIQVSKPSKISIEQSSKSSPDDFVNQQIQFVIDSLNDEINLALNNPKQGFQTFCSCRFKKSLSIFDDFVKQTEETIKKKYPYVSVSVQQTDTEFYSVQQPDDEFWFKISF